MRSLELVGVHHCGVAESLFISVPIRAYPSKDLVEKIRSFPKGTAVGLELPVKESEIPEFAKGFDRVLNQNEYFRDIRNICQENGLKIIYLDTIGYDEHLKILAEQSFLFDRAKTIKMVEESTGRERASEEEKLHLAREIYRLDKKAEHARVIVRDKGLLESIVNNTELRIAIVGQGHSAYWMLKKIFDEKGIKIEYMEDQIPEVNHMEFDMASEHGSSIQQTAKLVQNPGIDIKNTAMIEEIKRRFFAATKQRIFLDKKPDFVGTFDLQIPARGLFEMYINESEKIGTDEHINGIIEDVFGTAKFQGSIQGNEIFFFKEYFGHALWVGASRRGIRYDGRLKNGKCQGFFTCFTDHGEYKDDFNMVLVK